MFAPGFKQLGDYFCDLSVAQSEGVADNDGKSKLRLASRSLEVRLLLNCPYFAVLSQSSWFNTDSNSVLEFLTSASGAASKNYTTSHKVHCIEKHGRSGTERSKSTTSLPSTAKCSRLTAEIGKASTCTAGPPVSERPVT